MYNDPNQIHLNIFFRVFLVMPLDLVCGIEMDQNLAIEYDFENKKYFFCCEGCKRIFIKKPRKYKNKSFIQD